MRYSYDTDEWWTLDWNVFSCGTYCNSNTSWDACLGIYLDFTMEINLRDSVPIPNRDQLSGSFSCF